MSTSGEYHEYIEGCPVPRGFQYKSKAFIILLPHMNHDMKTPESDCWKQSFDQPYIISVN